MVTVAALAFIGTFIVFVTKKMVCEQYGRSILSDIVLSLLLVAAVGLGLIMFLIGPSTAFGGKVEEGYKSETIYVEEGYSLDFTKKKLQITTSDETKYYIPYANIHYIDDESLGNSIRIEKEEELALLTLLTSIRYNMYVSTSNTELIYLLNSSEGMQRAQEKSENKSSDPNEYFVALTTVSTSEQGDASSSDANQENNETSDGGDEQ